MQSAFAISDNGIVLGSGISPGNTNDMVMYDMNTGALTTLAVPAYAGVNSSIAFGISDNGSDVVGMSGNGSQAVIWSAATGVISIGLPSDTSTGRLKRVNDQGDIVGMAKINGTEYAFLLTSAAVLPEPASGALMLAGLMDGGLVVARRRAARRTLVA